MTNLSITAADVAVVKSLEQLTGPAGEALSAGQFCRQNTTTGHWELGKATTTAEALHGGIATKTVVVGQELTVLIKGVLDVGNALSSLTYDDLVYLSDTDGTLADATGTVEKLVGIVVPGFGATTPDKLLRIDL